MRSEYYQSLPSYEHLNNIRLMIQRGEDISQAIRTGLEHKLFTVNSYIQHPYTKQDCWVPLIYAVCLFEQYHDIVKMLLSGGANAKLEPDTEADKLEPILFACHSLYLGHLIKMGCNAKYNYKVLEHNMLLKLRVAEWRRLDILDRKGYISMNRLVTGYKGDLVMYCLKHMKEYLMYCYNIRRDSIDKTEETNKTIQKFVNTVIALFRWGHLPSVNAVNFCIRFYMYEFLQLDSFKAIINHGQYSATFHEDMDPVVVATYRPLLNDGRYTATCKLLSHTPDQRLTLKK